FHELIAQGAHNINLVNPTHFALAIGQALEEPLPVPVVWNSGGYDSVETLRALEGKIQVFLPDLKYLDRAAAAAYSAAPDYPEVAQNAIREMVRQTGPYLIEGGLMKRGVIIRHLILPGRAAGAKAVMDWIAAEFPPHTVMLSLMSQYTPWGRAKDLPGLDRVLRPSEIHACEAYFAALGLDGFTQELLSATDGFIPAFDFTGVSPERKK
ncbi:MAG: radical SAM protein, partial [Pseudoflavonifractor sp.]